MQCMMKVDDKYSCNNPVWTCRYCSNRGCQNSQCRNQGFDQGRCLACGRSSAT
jgi:hypothetical protein